MASVLARDRNDSFMLVWAMFAGVRSAAASNLGCPARLSRWVAAAAPALRRRAPMGTARRGWLQWLRHSASDSHKSGDISGPQLPGGACVPQVVVLPRGGLTPPAPLPLPLRDMLCVRRQRVDTCCAGAGGGDQEEASARADLLLDYMVC